jgi:amino acid permease
MLNINSRNTRGSFSPLHYELADSNSSHGVNSWLSNLSSLSRNEDTNDFLKNTDDLVADDDMDGMGIIRGTDDGDEDDGAIEQMSASSAPEADLMNRSTWLSCYINLTSTILGAGMLGLPYAYANTGWALGAFLIFVCGFFAYFGLYFLAECARRTSRNTPSSFYSIAKIAIPSYVPVIDTVIAIKCFGVATSYLIVIGDLMPMAIQHLAPSMTWGHDRSTWVVIGFLIVAPLSALRSLDALKYTSTLSGFFLLFLLLLVVGYAYPGGYDPCPLTSQSESSSVADLDVKLNECRGDRDWILLTPHAFHVMPIFVFGYACQQNTFAIVNELKRPTPERTNSVFVASILTAIVVYIIMASCGYISYGDAVNSNILVSYPNNVLTSLARVFVSFVVSTHYPLQAHPARKSVLSLLAYMYNNGVEPTNVFVYYARYILVVAIFLGLSLVIALTVEDLGVVLAFVGATGSTTITYILPGVFYYTLMKNDSRASKALVSLSKFQFIFGCCLVPLSLIAIFVVIGS